MNNTKINFSILALLISISWFVISFILGEDSLGGALHDFRYHEKYFYNFSDNFSQTINEYGRNSEVRNSPVFYILFSKLYSLGITIDNLKYFNFLIIFPILFFFNKCLDLRFKNIEKNTKFFLNSCIFLSPTIRSLINYPYPFIWALCFFLISVYFFLKFRKQKEFKKKNTFWCIFNLSIDSYFTPNFAVFIIFFFFHFFLDLKNFKNYFYIIISSFFLSLPALIFLIWKDFYIFKNNVFEVSLNEKINFSNKIIVISSFIIFFFIPYVKKINLSLSEVKEKTKNTNFVVLVFLIIFCIINFDFKYGAGGGFFYKLSILIFKNHVLLFLIFIFSIFYFYFNNLFNINNIIIFIILIIYNLQYSIYYKYFDPLLFLIFLLLIKIPKNQSLKLNNISKKYFLFYLLLLLMNIFKSSFMKNLII